MKRIGDILGNLWFYICNFKSIHAKDKKLKAENKAYEAQADRVLQLIEEQQVEDHFHGDNVQEW